MTSSEQISKVLKMMRENRVVDDGVLDAKNVTLILIECLETAVEALENCRCSKSRKCRDDEADKCSRCSALTQISELLQEKR